MYKQNHNQEGSVQRMTLIFFEYNQEVILVHRHVPLIIAVMVDSPIATPVNGGKVSKIEALLLQA